MFELENIKIGIVGLGYVGLPLAVELGKKYPTKGLDISAGRIAELQSGQDSTLEVEPDELKLATQLSYSSDPQALANCNFYIVTVPTPIDSAKRPDLSPLEGASRTLGKILKRATWWCLNPPSTRAPRKRSAYPFWRKSPA